MIRQRERVKSRENNDPLIRALILFDKGLMRHDSEMRKSKGSERCYHGHPDTRHQICLFNDDDVYHTPKNHSEDGVGWIQPNCCNTCSHCQENDE